MCGFFLQFSHILFSLSFGLGVVHTIQRSSFMGALPKLRACSILVFLCAQLLSAQKTPRRVEPPEIQQHIDKVTTCLLPMANDDPHPCATLSERMSALHIPGVSIAVFHNGVIWACGFGVKQVGGAPVTQILSSRQDRSVSLSPRWPLFIWCRINASHWTQT
jgi:hypothetical protein